MTQTDKKKVKEALLIVNKSIESMITKAMNEAPERYGG